LGLLAGTKLSEENGTFIFREEVCLLLQGVNAVVPVLLSDLSDLREKNAFVEP
jgi:hypothetical protein